MYNVDVQQTFKMCINFNSLISFLLVPLLFFFITTYTNAHTSSQNSNLSSLFSLDSLSINLSIFNQNQYFYPLLLFLFFFFFFFLLLLLLSSSFLFFSLSLFFHSLSFIFQHFLLFKSFLFTLFTLLPIPLPFLRFS